MRERPDRLTVTPWPARFDAPTRWGVEHERAGTGIEHLVTRSGAGFSCSCDGQPCTHIAAVRVWLLRPDRTRFTVASGAGGGLHAVTR